MAEIRELPWEKLSGCNILVTGATGLIGSCLVDVLMTNPNKYYQVYALGRNEKRGQARFLQFKDDASFHFLLGDVTQPLVSDKPFHILVKYDREKGVEAVAIIGNYIHSCEINRMLFVSDSTIFIYDKKGKFKLLNTGLFSPGEINFEGKKDSPDPYKELDYGYVDILGTRSCYPSSKRAAETLAMCYAGEYGADVVVARPCHTYGPHFTESDNRVYAQFIRNVLKGEDIVMKSSGTQYRSWCYVEDCVWALLYILLKGKSGEAYNIADKNSVVTIRELAETIAHIAGRKVVMQVASDVEKKGFTPIKHAVFDTAKLEALGWMVNGTMEEKLRRTIDICKVDDQGTIL